MNLTAAARWWAKRFSTSGMLIGAVFFALSLTPSLLPRTFLIQGLLSGCVFAAGYMLGTLLEWLLKYLQLCLPRERSRQRATVAVSMLCVLMVLYFLWRSSDWQNSIREAMGMPPVEAWHTLLIVVIAVFPAAALIAIGALLAYGARRVAAWLHPFVPRRLAVVLSVVVVGAVTGLLVDGVLVRGALGVADQVFERADQFAGQYEAAPADPLRSGSASSLIDWNTIGQKTRIYVQSGPTAEEIEAIIGRPAMTPLRVGVGFRSAETNDERAQLALAELQRIGAFDRSILVLIMPVGTGWVDPVGIDTLEFLHAGDVASVSVQYSYLTSWVSLVSQPDVGVDAAQALFTTIYYYWRQLPPETRPRLYLYGLSLGAYASEASTPLYDVLGDPFQGALWVGPPFANRGWRQAVDNREPETPAWLPRVSDSSAVRFTGQRDALDIPGAEWGPMRIVYLQYGSDPIVFFEPRAFYRRPEWLNDPRAPDVSSELDWYPAVTFLQLSFDLTISQAAPPIGFGHVYAPPDYIDAWVAVTEPGGWDAATLAELKAKLARTGTHEDIQAGWFRSGN